MLLFATTPVFSQSIFGGSISLDYNFLHYRIKITKKTTLMPELRYSFGITDIIHPTNSLYSQTIAKMRRDKVTFALNIF